MKKIIAIFAIAVPLLSSCGSKSLENYVPIIEDTIRGELAAANFIYSGSSSDIDNGLSIIGSLLDHLGYSRLADLTDYLKSDNLGNEIYELHEKNGLSYFDALTRISNDTSSPFADYAGQMLDVYQNLDIVIGEASVIKNTSSTKEWQLVESNSGVVFFFALTGLDTSSTSCQCYADEATLERYIASIKPDEIDASQTNPIIDGIVNQSNELIQEVKDKVETLKSI